MKIAGDGNVFEDEFAYEKHRPYCNAFPNLMPSEEAVSGL